MKVINIEKEINKWSNQQYREVDFNHELLDINLKTKTFELFKELGILNKYMNGFSTENLIRRAGSEGSGGLNMSKIFHACAKSGNISPGIYLAKYINEYIGQEKNEEKLLGYLARALRSFGSFLREPDLASKLKKGLKNHFKKIIVNMDPEQDTKGHIDILIICDDIRFQFWSYQASERGLPKTINRLSGNIGKVSDGINILCPLDTTIAKELNEKKNTYDKKTSQINNWQAELNTPTTSNSRKKNVADMIERHGIKHEEKRILIEKLKKEFDQNITEKDGWFLHSPNYIHTLVDKIISYRKGRYKTLKYLEVRNAIFKPIDIVKNINIFEK